MSLNVSTINVSPRVEAGSELLHLQRLVDLEAIRQLAGIYPILYDSRDLEALVALFTEDGALHRMGQAHTGPEQLRELYSQVLGMHSMTAHTVHQHLVDLAPGAASAGGVQMGHAEVALDDRRLVAAYRYDDDYRCVGGRWLFARRVMRYQYFSTHDDLGRSLSGRQRVRVPGAEPRDAEIPEDLLSHSAARPAHGATV